MSQHLQPASIVEFNTDAGPIRVCMCQTCKKAWRTAVNTHTFQWIKERAIET